VFGLDVYTWRTRVAPAALAAAPALALGIAALPLLPGAQKLWSLVGLGLTTYAALVARDAGNAVQPRLYEGWGGIPTTVRLRFSSGTSRAEIERRHRDVERAVGDGIHLPTADAEVADPVEADREYQAAMARVIAKVRSTGGFRLVVIENRNYGYARNMFGLRRLARWIAVGTLLASLVVGALIWHHRGASDARPLLLPAAVSLLALFLWQRVTPAFVRPNADAYADRVVEAAARLADSS
jgi:hypothetical protein